MNQSFIHETTTLNPTSDTITPSTTTYVYEYLLYSSSYILPYIPYNSVLGICVLFLDITVATVYLARLKDKSFVPGLYLLIALFDGVMVLGLYCQYIVLAVLTRASNEDYVSLWGLIISKVLIEVCQRISVFANTLLCVTRTINTARPFRRINKKVALGIFVGYIVFWLFVGLAEITLFATYFLDLSEIDPYVSFGRVGGNLCQNILGGCDVAGTHCTQGIACTFILTLLIPLMVPCILTIICLALMLVYMRREVPRCTSARRNRTVTLTVTYLTLVFVICIAPSVIYYFVYVFIMLGLLGFNHNQGTPTYDFILENMFMSTLPLLNALLTQVVIVHRSQDLRNSLRKGYKEGRDTLKDRFKVGNTEINKNEGEQVSTKFISQTASPVNQKRSIIHS